MGIQNREGALFFATGIQNDGLRRGKQEALGILKTFTRQVTGMDIFAGLGISATIALAKAGKEALQFSREFETAFAEVQTISETARINSEEMRESILQMTTEIPVGAVDSTKALYQIVSAGFDGAEAMNVLEISAKAAVAGVSTTATAADTITTIINAYGLSANEALNVSDALFKTVELGKTTLSEIGSSFSQVASISANYGIQLNEVLAAMAAMTKQGTSTGEAITNIRQAIISVSEKMGESIFKQMSLAEAFQYSREEAESSGEALREYYGRVQAVSGILQTTGDNAHFLSDALDGINNSTGSTDAALAVMNATFDKQYKLLQNNIIVAFSDFGDELKENLIPLLIKFNDLMETSDERVGKETKSRYSNIIAEAEKLNTVEEKRTFIVGKIGELYHEFLSKQEKVSNLEKERPGILRKYVELFNQAIGLGNQFTTGIDNEALVGYNAELIQGILNAQKQLKEYLNTLKDVPPPPPVEEPFDRKAEEEKLKKAQDAFEQYADLQSETSKQQFIKNNEFLEAGLTSFKQYLVKRYQMAKSYGEKMLLEEAASSVGTNLVRNSADPVTLQSKGSTDEEIREFFIKYIPVLSKDSINTLKYEIEQLNEEIDKETDDARLKDLSAERLILEEKLKQKKNIAEEEKQVYKDLLDTIQGAFGQIENLGYKTLENLKDKTKEIIDSAKIENPKDKPSFVLVNIEDTKEQGKAIQKQVKLTIEEFNKLQEKYNELNRLTKEKNPFKAIKKSFIELVRAVKSGNENAITEAINEFNSSIERGINTVNEWGETFDEIFGTHVSEATHKITGLVDGVSKLGVGVAKFASGDTIGGITSTLKGIASIVNVFSSSSEKLSERFVALNKEIQTTISSINQASDALKNLGANGTSLAMAKIDSGLKKVAKSAKDLNKELESNNKRRRGYTGSSVRNYGNLLRQSIDLNSEIEELSKKLLSDYLNDDQKKAVQEVLDSYNSLLNEIDTVTQDLTGITTNSLADSLSEAFLAGEAAAESWGKTVDDIIKRVIANQLSAKLLVDPINDAVATLIDNAESGGELTVDEGLSFKQKISDLADSVRPFYDTMRETLEGIGISYDDANSSSQSGIAGQINRVMTQDSATEIYGLWNGMYDTSKSQLQVQEEMLGIMRGGASLPNGSALDTTEIENQSQGLVGLESLGEQLQVQKDSMAILSKIENNTRETAENTEVLYDIRSEVVGKLDEVKNAIETNGSSSGSNRRDQGW